MMHESIKSKNAPKAVGPYSPAIRLGDFVLTSGQLPINPETGKIVEGGIEEQTKQCLLNIKALLEEVDIDLKYVLKTTIYLKDMNDFAKMNEVYSSFFSQPYPARAAVEVSRLAGDALIEIEAWAMDTRALEVLCSSSQCGCDDECCSCDDSEYESLS